MFRACLLVCCGGCSLVLDFSDSAVPADATIDGPVGEAECAFGEPNDSLGTAGLLAPTDVGPAGICPIGGADDHDFYRFTVPAATASVTIRVSFTKRPSGDLDLKLYDKSGSSLATSRSFGEFEMIMCPGSNPACSMLPADDYIFEVFPGTGGATNRYDLALTITPM